MLSFLAQKHIAITPKNAVKNGEKKSRRRSDTENDIAIIKEGILTSLFICQDSSDL